jgi:hypothetical protein
MKMTAYQPVTIHKKFREKVEQFATTECGVTNCLYASTYIQQLNSHIDGTATLSFSEIEHKLDFLIGCTTITLDNGYEGLELLRARRCELQPFSNVNELSYIQKPSKSFPKLGRLNQTGEALFYAAIINSKCNKSLNVILSEAGARTLDKMSILRSVQKESMELTLRIIGLWDDILRGVKPLFMSDEVYEYYCSAYDYMVEKFPSKLLVAYQLTDRFLADIMSRKGSERLYEVTSCASKIMLDDKKQEKAIDGIIYSSVEAKGEAVVALKPDAVDKMLEHQWVSEVLVNMHHGYEFFDYVTVSISNINTQSGSLIKR